MKANLAVLVIALFVLLAGCNTIPDPVPYEPVRPDYWPTIGWREATPESQGMDSERLADMVDFYHRKQGDDLTLLIDSITIVRNGYVVADIYLNPLYPADTPHIINSSAKSFVSALVGIAISEGHLEGVEQPVIDILEPNGQVHDRLAALTIQDLLTMQTGMRALDSVNSGWVGLTAMENSDDWVQHALALPFDAEPGERFDYSNISTFLLSAIISEATGQDTLDYAREKLFDPMGIEDVRWERNPDGITVGFARLWMKPRDMAKFGLLFLQKGMWDGQQLVPAAWVEESTTAYSSPSQYREILDIDGEVDRGRSRATWILTNLLRPFSDGYGYQFWIDESGSYTALGVGGQYIMVFPEENLVAVFTSKLIGINAFWPPMIVDRFVQRAIESDEPIEENPEALAELAARLGPPPLEAEQIDVPGLPAIASDISGARFGLTENRWKNDNLEIEFEEGRAFALMTYDRGPNTLAYRVGLDGLPRVTETSIGSFAATGGWLDESTFAVDYEWIGYTDMGRFEFSFGEDQVNVVDSTVVGSQSYTGSRQ